MQFTTQKEKLNFLLELKNTQVDLQNIKSLLEIANTNFQKSILDRIFESLAVLDIKISVLYEYSSVDEWEQITKMDQTQSDDQKDITESIKVFIGCYCELKMNICNFDVSLVWKVLEKYVIGAKTKHLQFLLFDLLTKNIKNMNQLMKNAENGKNLAHLVFLFGLLVRYKFDQDAVNKICKFLLEKACKWKGARFLVCLQGFMYVCCFRQELDPLLKDFIVTNKDKWKKLNKKVVDVYCSVFEHEYNEITCGCIEILEYFPFDKPCLDNIFAMYEDMYLIFKRRNT